VLVFIGATQTKVPRHVAVAMQLLGEKAKYIEIEGSGPNALDFHIAYYIGELSAADPAARFHVISKDRGFDPLIRHLKEKKINVQRESDLAEIPSLRIPKKAKKDDKMTLTEAELSALVNELQKRKQIRVNNGNIKYTLSA
jgi:hypothetical protein